MSRRTALVPVRVDQFVWCSLMDALRETRLKPSLLTTPVVLVGLPILGVSVVSVFSAGLRGNVGWLPLIPVVIGLAYFGRVNIPGSKVSISISDTAILVGLILFGVQPAVILASTDALFHSLKTAKKISTHTYNIATIVISIFVASYIAGLIFPGAFGRSGLNFDASRLAGPLGLAALIYYCTDYALLTMLMAVRQRENVLRIWRESFQMVGLGYLANGSTAGIVCLLIKYVHFYVILIVAPIICVIFFTYKIYSEKVESSTRHLAELSSLYNQVSTAKAEWESTFNAMSDVI